MGGMSNAHPAHFFVRAFLVVDHSCGGGALGSERTKVLSKDEWARISMLVTRRGVAGSVVAVERAWLLLWPIVAHRSRLVMWCDGGLRVESVRVAHAGARWKRGVMHRNVINNIIA